MAPVTPLLQCEPNPIAVTKIIEIIFIRKGIYVLRPPSLRIDAASSPLLLPSLTAVTPTTSFVFSRATSP